MTVAKLLREMSVREFVLWRLKYAEDPWGESRRDLSVAQLCALTANVNRDPKKRDEPFGAIDFMPYLKRRQEEEQEKVKEEEGTKVDPLTVTWLMWKANKDKRGH